MSKPSEASRAGRGLRDATAEEFHEIVGPIVPKLALLAHRQAGPDHWDDVLQEAMMRAWTKRHQFDPARGSLVGWLLAITADQARKSHRRRPRGHPHVAIEAAVIDIEQRLDIHEAVSRLPPRQKMAVDCYYFVGLSVVDTANAMNCSEGTVKSNLADARRRLRASLERRS